MECSDYLEDSLVPEGNLLEDWNGGISEPEYWNNGILE